MTFYLTQLEDVESDPDQTLTLSQTTIDLCLAALIPAQYRTNWEKDLEPLSDTEWAKAEDFLRIAIEELTGV
jgi:hypothetical protein